MILFGQLLYHIMLYLSDPTHPRWNRPSDSHERTVERRNRRVVSHRRTQERVAAEARIGPVPLSLASPDPQSTSRPLSTVGTDTVVPLLSIVVPKLEFAQSRSSTPPLSSSISLSSMASHLPASTRLVSASATSTAAEHVLRLPPPLSDRPRGPLVFDPVRVFQHLRLSSTPRHIPVPQPCPPPLLTPRPFFTRTLTPALYYAPAPQRSPTPPDIVPHFDPDLLAILPPPRPRRLFHTDGSPFHVPHRTTNALQLCKMSFVLPIGNASLRLLVSTILLLLQSFLALKHLGIHTSAALRTTTWITISRTKPLAVLRSFIATLVRIQNRIITLGSLITMTLSTCFLRNFRRSLANKQAETSTILASVAFHTTGMDATAQPFLIHACVYIDFRRRLRLRLIAFPTVRPTCFHITGAKSIPIWTVLMRSLNRFSVRSTVRPSCLFILTTYQTSSSSRPWMTFTILSLLLLMLDLPRTICKDSLAPPPHYFPTPSLLRRLQFTSLTSTLRTSALGVLPSSTSFFCTCGLIFFVPQWSFSMIRLNYVLSFAFSFALRIRTKLCFGLPIRIPSSCIILTPFSFCFFLSLLPLLELSSDLSLCAAALDINSD